MLKYLLAHDIGTSGDKATLFTTDGILVNSSTVHYRTYYPKHNWAEQNPSDWWKAVCSATQDLIKAIDPAEISSVSFSGQMMGCVCVDQEGLPLRNSIIYCDQRAVNEVNTVADKIDPYDFYKIAGHRLSAVYSLAKYLWVKRNQPEIFKKTHKLLQAKDYIVFKLTGEFVTDQSDASGTNAYDLINRDWSDSILEIAQIEREKLPEILPSTQIVGTISRQAEQETGLKRGTPVVIGAGDGSAVAVGVGSITPGSAYTYLGSSAWMGISTEQPFRDEQMRTMTWAHAVPDLYHPTGSMQAAGTTFQWLKDEICQLEIKEAQELGINVFELINEKISQSVPGSNGIIFLPYLIGERSPHWNPNAKGAFVGIKLTNNRSNMLRSVLEGISFNLRLILDIFKGKTVIDEMILVGGAAQSRVWAQIIADIYETKILIPNYLEEATAIGAAVIGGVGVGALKDFKAIERFIKISAVVEPIHSHQAIYQKSLKLFSETYDSLVDVFEKL